MLLEGFTPYRKADAEKYNRLRWWSGLTFGDLLDRAADIYPDKEALVEGEIHLTYGQLRERVDRLGVSFMELGINTHDRVLLQMPNWNEFVIAYFALEKIGAIPVLLIPRYREYEINTFSRLTGARFWILPEQYRGLDYRPIIKGVVKDNPQIEQVILVRGDNPGGFVRFEKLLEKGKGSEKNLQGLAERRPDPMDVAHMGATGGTTSLPKVVPRTHNDYLCRVEYAARARELNSHDTLLVVAPISHDLTFSIGLCSTIITFGRTVMLDATDPESICTTIQRERVTNVAWTPALAHPLLNFEGRQDYDLSSLRVMYCGGGTSSPDLVKEATEKLGCDFLNGYGGTEGMSTLPRLNYDIERRARTVGRQTCPYDTYKVVDAGGEELSPNMPGELVVKGPSVFTGYYNTPEENARVFDRNGFFRTGDQAMINNAGDIIITGRIKDIIIRGGENISPLEIENLITHHPDVIAVAVIGMPDQVMGERACAYIQPRSGAEVDLEGIVAFLKERGASVLQFPERVELVDAMPVGGPKGLVDKKVLLEDIKKKIDGMNLAL